jgi:hypothetical protein
LVSCGSCCPAFVRVAVALVRAALRCIALLCVELCASFCKLRSARLVFLQARYSVLHLASLRVALLCVVTRFALRASCCGLLKACFACCARWRAAKAWLLRFQSKFGPWLTRCQQVACVVTHFALRASCCGLLKACFAFCARRRAAEAWLLRFQSKFGPLPTQSWRVAAAGQCTFGTTGGQR